MSASTAKNPALVSLFIFGRQRVSSFTDLEALIDSQDEGHRQRASLKSDGPEAFRATSSRLSYRLIFKLCIENELSGVFVFSRRALSRSS